MEKGKQNIEKLLFDKDKSGAYKVSSYRISKETGMSEAALNKFRRKESDVGNMTLDNAIKLDAYYKKMESEGDVEVKDRDMLFGRLFAVSHVFGERVFEKDKQSVELKYMDRFKKKPIETFEKIHADLMSYVQKFGSYENSLIDKFTEIIGELGDDLYTNDPLGDKFLLGLYKQRHELNNAKDGEAGE